MVPDYSTTHIAFFSHGGASGYAGGFGSAHYGFVYVSLYLEVGAAVGVNVFDTIVGVCHLWLRGVAVFLSENSCGRLVVARADRRGALFFVRCGRVGCPEWLSWVEWVLMERL